MSTIIKLRGIAWDHPRGYEPLRATSKAFCERMNLDSGSGIEVNIEWDIRSLKDFGDMPIEDLIDQYDLITIDHPYMGQADKHGLLLALNENLSDDVLQQLVLQSVGPSFQSYYYGTSLYALPIDAAALVSAYRKDIVTHFDLRLPQTREELFDFYQKLPKGLQVAWPLCATDIWCSFLSLCAQDAGADFIHKQTIDQQVACKVLDELKRHLEFLHPQSINWNPIKTLDHMSTEADVVFSPYLFGYTNYARDGYAKRANSTHPDLALKYLEYVSSAEVQTGLFTQYGGQPGNLAAWQSRANNQLCGGFFDDTLTTMQQAYVRPNHPGWNHFQEHGAELIHHGVVANVTSKKIMSDLNQLYQSID